MNIVITNQKGGVGKSMIAHQLITQYGFLGVEIDPYGDLAERLPQQVQKIGLTDTLPTDVENTIFDFGGFDDVKVDQAVALSDLVIIPFIATPESLQATIKTVNKVKEFDKPILFIANMSQKEQDIQEAKFVFDDILGFECHLVTLPLSVALQTAIFENRSVVEMMNEGGLKKFAYKRASENIQKIFEAIEFYN